MPRRALDTGVSLAAWAVLAALTGGCQTTQPQTAPPPQPKVDLCAERLQDLGGQLLLYWSAHQALPPTLDGLPSGQTLRASPRTCPVSGKPYVYSPAGLVVAGLQGRLVLYDPEPTHSGMREGILVAGPTGTGLITANVVQVAERDFAAARP